MEQDVEVTTRVISVLVRHISAMVVQCLNFTGFFEHAPQQLRRDPCNPMGGANAAWCPASARADCHRPPGESCVHPLENTGRISSAAPAGQNTSDCPIIWSQRRN
jgi:hypothetical protein